MKKTTNHMSLLIHIFTARIRRIGKVMRSQVCVYLRGVPQSLVQGPFIGDTPWSCHWYVKSPVPGPRRDCPLARIGVLPRVRKASACSAAVHSSLAVTQDDFLVIMDDFIPKDEKKACFTHCCKFLNFFIRNAQWCESDLLRKLCKFRISQHRHMSQDLMYTISAISSKYVECLNI